MKSKMTKAELDATRHKYQMPNDVYFYMPDDFERVDWPLMGMIAIHEGWMDVGLQFPLHPAILHLPLGALPLLR